MEATLTGPSLRTKEISLVKDMPVEIWCGDAFIDAGIVKEILEQSSDSQKIVFKSVNCYPGELSIFVCLSKESPDPNNWALLFKGLNDKECFNPRGGRYQIKPARPIPGQ